MKTEYAQILSLELAHSYYASGRSNDFDFVFTEQTRRLFQQGRLVPKLTRNGLSVFIELRDDQLALEVAGKTLDIGLVLKTPNFYNFTDKPLSGGVTRFINAAQTRTFDPATTCQIVGQRFTHTISKAKRNVDVSMEVDGVIVDTRLVKLSHGLDRVNFLNRQVDVRDFDVIEQFSGEPSLRHHYFQNAELAALPIDTLVSIELHETFVADPPRFKLEFNAKSETLSYYIVARNYGSNFNALAVTGIDKADPSAPAAIAFNKVTASNFTAQHLAKEVLGVGGQASSSDAAKVVLFQSALPLSRREKAKRDIQLSIQGDVLIPSLPLTGPERLTSDFIVHLSKPKT